MNNLHLLCDNWNLQMMAVFQEAHNLCFWQVIWWISIVDLMPLLLSTAAILILDKIFTLMSNCIIYIPRLAKYWLPGKTRAGQYSMKWHGGQYWAIWFFAVYLSWMWMNYWNIYLQLNSLNKNMKLI